MNAILAGDMRLCVGADDLKAIKRELTIKMWDHSKEKTISVKAYRIGNNYISVPRQYGISYAEDNNIPITEKVSDGYPIKGLKKIKLREGQDYFVNDLEDYFISGIADDCRAEGYAGFGKTVCGLEYIRRRGRTALVIVDQEFLRDQWVREAKDKLGMTDKDIGFIQGKLCEYKDKKLVIGMVQTLYSRKYEDDLYSYFGTLLIDECHCIGSEQFSKVLMQFPARVRFGVSATPERGDKLDKLLELNIGKVEVVVLSKHNKSTVSYVEYDGVISWYANISPKNGAYISEIAKDDRRNDLLVWIINDLYMRGRTILVVSDRAEHIHNLKYMCMARGVPEKDIGVVTTYDHIWKYAKDATPPRKPIGLVKGAEYTPIKIQMSKKKITKVMLEENKDTKRIVLSTYSMFSKGVDVPHLDAGIDATPRQKAKQVHGRILRSHKGKKTPLWITIRDIMSYKAEFQFSRRIMEYEESNAEIYQWHPHKGTRKVDTRALKKEALQRVKILRAAEIVQTPEGRNTVVMPLSGSG